MTGDESDCDPVRVRTGWNWVLANAQFLSLAGAVFLYGLYLTAWLVGISKDVDLSKIDHNNLEKRVDAIDNNGTRGIPATVQRLQGEIDLLTQSDKRIDSDIARLSSQVENNSRVFNDHIREDQNKFNQLFVPRQR